MYRQGFLLHLGVHTVDVLPQEQPLEDSTHGQRVEKKDDALFSMLYYSSFTGTA